MEQSSEIGLEVTFASRSNLHQPGPQQSMFGPDAVEGVSNNSLGPT